MRKNNIIRGLTVAGTAAGLIGGAAASANAYTMDSMGKGWVGKGEVQSVFGWNNSTMQANHTSITFSTKQDATQVLSSTAHQTATQAGSQSATQDGSQVVSQAGTQAVTETLSCTKTTGNVEQRFRTGTRDGEAIGERSATRTAEREATRGGARDGSRTGSRDGTLSGSIKSAVDVTNRKTGQWTGWFLNGYNGSPVFVASGPEEFNAPSFGEWGFGNWSFDGNEWSFGELRWLR